MSDFNLEDWLNKESLEATFQSGDSEEGLAEVEVEVTPVEETPPDTLQGSGGDQ